jgi:hypothetical protein
MGKEGAEIMFYGQCNDCGERWELGTARTCTCKAEEMKSTIDMAREVYGAHTEWSGAPLDRMEQLVALVRADEREQLTNLDWTALMRQGGLVTWGDAGELGDRVVAAIRARGNT